MSRAGCKHGRSCCSELCPLDAGFYDFACNYYEDSGYRGQIPVSKERARILLIGALDDMRELMKIKLTFDNGKELLKKIDSAKKRVQKYTRIVDGATK